MHDPHYVNVFYTLFTTTTTYGRCTLKRITCGCLLCHHYIVETPSTEDCAVGRVVHSIMASDSLLLYLTLTNDELIATYDNNKERGGKKRPCRGEPRVPGPI